MPPCCAASASWAYRLQDLDTSRSSLEDIFVDLVEEAA
jgi:hypothetical protein